MHVTGISPSAGCEAGGAVGPWLWSVSIVDDANSRPEVKVVLTRQ